MGSPATEPERESWQAGTESPLHEVVIPRAFEIGRFPVTVAEFAAFVAATGYRMDGSCHVFDGKDWTPRSDASWRGPGFSQADVHPVVCVGWHDAMAYVSWLNAQTGGSRYRLPSEAEREYAARAGASTPFWWGRTISPSDANYDHREVYAGSATRGPYRGSTVPVRSYTPNGWGLYQVHGNVWEWTADCYVDTYADKTPHLLLDGATPRTDRGCDRRSLRGGAFNRHPNTLRAAYRTGLDPSFRGHSIGFRVARSLAAPPPHIEQ
jgi:formylglycine-generating enzyme required for sulfatase activity